MDGRALVLRQVRPALAAAVALGLSLVVATPVAAQDTTPPELLDVTLSTDAVSVSGLNFRRVTVSVHLRDDTGVVRYRSEDVIVTPVVVLTRDEPPGRDVRWLELASGTPTDGLWTAEVLVPSTYDGSWRVSAVAAQDEEFNELDIDPATIGIDRRLEVIGTHQPRLTLRMEEAPPGADVPFMGLGRLTFSDTGRPIGGHPLFVGADEYCPGSFERVTTNADGRYQFRMLGFDFACVSMIAPEPSGDRYDYLNVALIHYRVVRPEGEITPPPTNAAGLEPVGTEAALSPGLVLLAAALSLVALGRRVRTSEHTPASR